MMTSHPPARPTARSLGRWVGRIIRLPSTVFRGHRGRLTHHVGSSGSGTHVGRAVREYSTSCLLIRYIFEITKFVFR